MHKYKHLNKNISHGINRLLPFTLNLSLALWQPQQQQQQKWATNSTMTFHCKHTTDNVDDNRIDSKWESIWMWRSLRICLVLDIFRSDFFFLLTMFLLLLLLFLSWIWVVFDLSLILRWCKAGSNVRAAAFSFISHDICVLYLRRACQRKTVICAYNKQQRTYFMKSLHEACHTI